MYIMLHLCNFAAIFASLIYNRSTYCSRKRITIYKYIHAGIRSMLFIVLHTLAVLEVIYILQYGCVLCVAYCKTEQRACLPYFNGNVFGE